MNCRNFVKCYFSILVALSLTPQPKVFAQSNPNGCQAEEYQLTNVADTQRLTAKDVLDTQVQQIGNNRQQELPTNSPYKLNSNSIDEPSYWQMRVKNSDLPINDSDVKYTLISSTEADNPFKTNRVELRVINIEQEKCLDNDTTVIKGGISFVFKELSNLVPGNYQGLINVCVPVNGVQCD